jgi:DHA1 family bicyclomycin/chloramphenicol resistance-like MFS transporter
VPQKVAIWLLVVTMGCGTVGVTVISPALNSISEYFRVDRASSQLLLTVYFISVAFFQLVYGPLSDRFGRRRPLLYGLGILAFGGLLGAIAESFEVLILARVFQGMGAASIYSIVRAIINDSYGRVEGASALATITGIMMVAPIFSLASGGVITELIGWKGAMFVIFLAGLIPFALNLTLLPETNLYQIQKVNFDCLVKNHISIVANPLFLSFMFASSSCVGIWFTMLGFFPFEYQRIGVESSEIGFWFIFGPLGFAVGNFFSRSFIQKWGIIKMAQIGGLLSFLAMTTLLLPSQLNWSHPILLGGPCLVSGFAAGFVMAPTTMGAIASTGKLGGSASGIIGATQMGFGVLGGSLVVFFGGYETFENGVLVLMGLALLTILSSMLAKRVSKKAH